MPPAEQSSLVSDAHALVDTGVPDNTLSNENSGACLRTSQLLPFRGLCGRLGGVRRRSGASGGLLGALGGSPAGGGGRGAPPGTKPHHPRTLVKFGRLARVPGLVILQASWLQQGGQEGRWLEGGPVADLVRRYTNVLRSSRYSAYLRTKVSQLTRCVRSARGQGLCNNLNVTCTDSRPLRQPAETASGRHP